MESRPWIARPTIHQNRPQNSIVLSERISLISILTKILTPVYLENIWFLDKTWIQTTEISVKSKRETPLSPKIRDAFPHLWSGLSWVLSVTTCCWCVGTLSAPAARYPANADPTIEQNWFSTALYTNTTRLVRAKSATNRLKIKESSVGLPFQMFLCCKLYVAWMMEGVYLVVWLLSISRLRGR